MWSFNFTNNRNYSAWCLLSYLGLCFLKVGVHSSINDWRLRGARSVVFDTSPLYFDELCCSLFQHTVGSHSSLKLHSMDINTNRDSFIFGLQCGGQAVRRLVVPRVPIPDIRPEIKSHFFTRYLVMSRLHSHLSQNAKSRKKRQFRKYFLCLLLCSSARLFNAGYEQPSLTAVPSVLDQSRKKKDEKGKKASDTKNTIVAIA